MAVSLPGHRRIQISRVGIPPAVRWEAGSAGRKSGDGTRNGRRSGTVQIGVAAPLGAHLDELDAALSRRGPHRGDELGGGADQAVTSSGRPR